MHLASGRGPPRSGAERRVRVTRRDGPGPPRDPSRPWDRAVAIAARSPVKKKTLALTDHDSPSFCDNLHVRGANDVETSCVVDFALLALQTGGFCVSARALRRERSARSDPPCCTEADRRCARPPRRVRFWLQRLDRPCRTRPPKRGDEGACSFSTLLKPVLAPSWNEKAPSLEADGPSSPHRDWASIARPASSGRQSADRQARAWPGRADASDASRAQFADCISQPAGWTHGAVRRSSARPTPGSREARQLSGATGRRLRFTEPDPCPCPSGTAGRQARQQALSMVRRTWYCQHANVAIPCNSLHRLEIGLSWNRAGRQRS